MTKMKTLAPTAPITASMFNFSGFSTKSKLFHIEKPPQTLLLDDSYQE